MRIPAVDNLIIYRNTDFIHQLDFETLNISTYTFVSKIRDLNNNLIEEFTITKPTNFKVQLALSQILTQDLELETYNYDVIQTVAGVSELILKGVITVENTITNLV